MGNAQSRCRATLLLMSTESTEESIDEADLAAITPNVLQKAAGGALMFVGLFGLVLAAQTAGIVRLEGYLVVVLVVMTTLAATLLVAGWKTTKGRGTAALIGAIASALNGLLGLAWLVFSFSHALFSLVALFLGPASIGAAVLAALVIGRGRHADDARERLAAQGFSSGT